MARAFLVFGLALLACCAGSGPPTGESVEPPGGVSVEDTGRPALPAWHTVKRLDTLWGIAVRYLGDGRRWHAIVDANPGLEPREMAVGDHIYIPRLEPTDPQSADPP